MDDGSNDGRDMAGISNSWRGGLTGGTHTAASGGGASGDPHGAHASRVVTAGHLPFRAVGPDRPGPARTGPDRAEMADQDDDEAGVDDQDDDGPG